MAPRNSRLPIVVSLALSACGGACAPPDTSERGFGSTQVMHVRDTGLELRAFSLDNAGIYLAHAIPDIEVPRDLKRPYDRSLFTFATGVEKPISVGVLGTGAWTLPSADGLGRSLLMTHFTDDSLAPPVITYNSVFYLQLTSLDEVTGATTEIPEVNSNSVGLGLTRSEPITVTRRGADGKAADYFGMPEALTPIPQGWNLVGRDRKNFIVLSQALDMSRTQTFSRIPFAPFDLMHNTLVVPGTVSAYTSVAGVDGPAVSSTATIPSEGVDAGISCPRATPTDVSSPCLLFYDRNKLTTGGRAPFVHRLDADAMGEFELPGPLGSALSSVVHVSPTAWDIFWPSTSLPLGARLYAWHVGAPLAASCELPGQSPSQTFGMNAWRPVATLPDGSDPGPAQFAIVAQPTQNTAQKPATWTLAMGTASVGCQVVATGSNLIKKMSWAPDGSRLAFLEGDPIEVYKLYVTDQYGTALTMVATGAYFFQVEFHDPRHLMLWHSNTDGYSLSWLELSTTPATEHPIADRVNWDARIYWAWLNDRWLLLADDMSDEDKTYALHVVDLETGTRKLISRGVRDFRTSWGSTTAPPGATDLTVAYLVQSRAASSQDGLWVAHLSLSDFPP